MDIKLAHDRADQCIRRGQLVEAEHVLLSIVDRFPGDSVAIQKLATVLIQSDRPQEAVDKLNGFLRRKPKDISSRLFLARIFRLLLRDDEALKQLLYACRINGQLPVVWNNLGNLYRDLANPKEAEKCLKHAVALDPKLSEAWNNLGALYSELGDREKAEKYYRKAIDNNPAYFKAWRNFSFTHHFNEFDEHAKKIQELFESNVDDDFAIAQLGFALGKVYEDLGEFSLAFEYWISGNRAQRKLQPYSIEAQIYEMQEMSRIFTAEKLSESSGAYKKDLLPIFIVGMPRSGTSLVERVIDSHSKGYGAGELGAIRQFAWESVQPGFPAALDKHEAGDWRKLGERYLDLISEKSSKSRYVVDKMPNNFIHLGMMKMMFRDMRIIHCRRDPMDVALSCFKNHFLSPDLGFCCDLEDFGDYYLAYGELMNYWKDLFPDEIYDLEYERFVSDPEDRIKHLLNWCGMPFEESCLEFYKHKKMVPTASALQVRKPAYTDSIGKWKAFKNEMQPLIAKLGA